LQLSGARKEKHVEYLTLSIKRQQNAAGAPRGRGQKGALVNKISKSRGRGGRELMELYTSLLSKKMGRKKK